MEVAETWFQNVLYWSALAGSHREAAREFDAPGLSRLADKFSANAGAEMTEWLESLREGHQNGLPRGFRG